MKNLVSGLFRRSTQLKTALAVKSHKWQGHDYALFLQEVSKQSKNRLDKETIKHLQQPLLHKVSGSKWSPLCLHLCIEYLQLLGPLDRSLMAAMYIEQKEYERALLAVDPNETPDVLVRLYRECGALEELYSLSKTHSLAIEVAVYLFEQLVDRGAYNAAKDVFKRYKLLSVVPKSLCSRLIVLACDNGDVECVQSLARDMGDYPASRQVFNSLVDLGSCELDGALDLLSRAFVDPREVPRARRVLVSHVEQVCAHLKADMNVDIASVLLYGLYESKSALLCFHVYRYLNVNGLVPDVRVARTLANAAYRLGDSKQVSYLILQEMDKYDVQLPRQVWEALLQSQLVGSGCRSSLYFLYRMRKERVYLRQHVQSKIASVFEMHKDALFADMFVDFGKLDKYHEFDEELALAESTSRVHAQRNASIYALGFKPGQPFEQSLLGMLEFEVPG